MSVNLEAKRVFVTGATGFIGGYLARRLHAEGASVFALERQRGKGADLAALGMTVVQGDITDHGRMREIIAVHQPQIVMHIAAWLGGTNRTDAQRVNVAASQNLAEVSAAAGVERFVFTSSIAAYGIVDKGIVDETRPLGPYGDPYGDSKIRAETVLRAVADRTGLAIVIVRPGMVYGPGSPGWTRRIAKWARQGYIPLIDGGQGTAFPIYIDNLIDLLLLCAIHPQAVGETFNAVDDGPVTLADFLGAYMGMAHTNRAIRLPGWLAKAVATVVDPFVRRYKLTYVVGQMCARATISNQKAKDLLSWSPQVGLQEGLRRSEAWLRSEGILA